MPDNKCIIVGGGEFYGISCSIGENDLVIAADRGYELLKSLGITPDIIVGDFDSALTPPEEGSAAEIVRLRVEKDDTDMGHAVSMGLERGYKDFRLFGCMGGRESHTIANIRLLSYITENGGRGIMYGENSELTVIRDGSISYGRESTGMLSVFSMTELSEGVTIKGLKYEVSGLSLRYSDSIGVSNFFLGRDAMVSVDKGMLLLIHERKEREAGTES